MRASWMSFGFLGPPNRFTSLGSEVFSSIAKGTTFSDTLASYIARDIGALLNRGVCYIVFALQPLPPGSTIEKFGGIYLSSPQTARVCAICYPTPSHVAHRFVAHRQTGWQDVVY